MIDLTDVGNALTEQTQTVILDKYQIKDVQEVVLQTILNVLHNICIVVIQFEIHDVVLTLTHKTTPEMMRIIKIYPDVVLAENALAQNHLMLEVVLVHKVLKILPEEFFQDMSTMVVKKTLCLPIGREDLKTKEQITVDT